MIPPSLKDALGARLMQRDTKRELLDFRTDDYSVQLGEEVALEARALLSLPVGWRYDFFDAQGALAFSTRRGVRLPFHKLFVNDAAGARIGRIQQRTSLMDLKYDLLDAKGKVCMKLFQPENESTFYFLLDAQEVGTLKKRSRDGTEWMEIEMVSKALTEQHRVLMLAAALLIHRVDLEGRSDDPDFD